MPRLTRDTLLKPLVPFSLLVMLSLSGFMLMVWLAARWQDQSFTLHTNQQLRTRLLAEQTLLVKQLRDYAVWDDMAIHIPDDSAPDLVWLRSNLTPTIYSDFQIDTAAIFDPDNALLYYVLQQGHERSFRSATVLPGWSTLQSATRHPSTSVSRAQSIVLREGNYYYWVAFMPIQKQTAGNVARSHRYMVFYRQISAQYLDAIRKELVLDRLTLQARPDPAKPTYIPLLTPDNSTLGYLVWQVQQPGARMLQRLWLPVLLFCGLLLGLAGWLATVIRAGQRRTAAASHRLIQQGESLRTMVSSTSTQVLPLNQRIDHILGIAVHTLQRPFISLWQLEPVQQQLRCTHVSPESAQALLGKCIPFPRSAPHRQRLMQQHTVVSEPPDPAMHAVILQANLSDPASLAWQLLQHEGEFGGLLCAGAVAGHNWHSDELNYLAALADFIALQQERSARSQVEGQLYRQLYYDAESNAPNTLHLQMQWQQRNPADTATRVCALLDLNLQDDFSGLLGPGGWPALLAQLVQRLQPLLYGQEAFARIGRTRFALLLYIAPPLTLEQRIDMLLSNLSQPLSVQGHQLVLRPRLGISVHGRDADDFHSLLQHAELALQQNLQQAYQGWTLFDTEVKAQMARQQLLSNDLHHALERQQLMLHYQPVVESRSGRIVAVEALLRWQHPTLGMVPPDQFIPLAEANELIIPIGNWVLQTAGEQIALWRNQCGRLLPVAVNLSAAQLHDPRLAVMLEQILARHNLPPRALELELTERIMLEPSPALGANLAQLRTLGISIAIDDFGAGHASFNYLLQFQVQKLKIDRMFMSGVPGSSNHSQLVSMIVNMGHSLGIEVTGEGIEQEEQATFLRQIGCNYMQGYLFSRPVDATHLLQQLLREQETQPALSPSSP
ncbi:EAL domain-containing protein [Leeia sp.]|uniref:EAL domain-containing protein n=1 Tax=Leeia sp. TaxID=2884678 RepID=UPI0035B346EB